MSIGATEMRLQLIGWLLLGICGFAVLKANASFAQEAQADVGTARQHFDELFDEWKRLLVDLRELRTEFQLAEDSRLAEIRRNYDEQRAAGEAMIPQLREATLAAYQEAPNEDRELGRFLLKLAADQIRLDDYLGARKILEVMAENDCDERDLPNLLGIAAFGTNDFDLAEEFLQEAKKKGTLTQQGESVLSLLPESRQAWPREMELRQAEATADDLPRVRLETTAGDIVLELFENEAPETVGNFVSLVSKGFYDGLTFHRVLPGFMAQGGCPNGDGTGGPGYKIYCESVNEDHRKHFAGSLSMAKELARHTGGSQFFITFLPTPQLDGQHTVFGRVVEGMEVLPAIVKQDPEARQAQPQPTKIITATVLRKRDHEYRPNKVK